MHLVRSHRRRLTCRQSLATLHAVMAFWCLAGMAYALGGAQGVDPSWLENSPFSSYVVPGFILGIIVGGAHAVAAAAVRARIAHDDELSAAAGLVLIIWILTETLFIGLVSPLQPIVLVSGLALFALSLRLEEPRR